MRWFRVYDELIDDPKAQRLPGELFKALINLWCIACQNDGRLPSIENIAFKLRLKDDRAKKVLHELRTRGFIDEDDKGLFPHNWNGRQFKSDESYERVKRFRQRKNDDGDNGNETFHEPLQKRPQSQSQNQSHDDAEDARAAHGKSMLSEEAKRLTDDIGQVAGFTKETWPPGWCGAVYIIQKFMDQGCPGEIIKLGVIGALKRKRDGPPQSFSYFEKPIAQAFAEHSRPVPSVVIDNSQEVTHGQRSQKPPSMFAYLAKRRNDLQAEIEADSRGSDDPDGGLASTAD